MASIEGSLSAELVPLRSPGEPVQESTLSVSVDESVAPCPTASKYWGGEGGEKSSGSAALQKIDGGRKYASKEYWDKRYEISGEETLYDWHQTYAGMKAPLEAVVKHDDRILMLGCGNAGFSADMHDDGFEKIVNIDISDTCIEQMKVLNADRPAMEWEAMDATDLKYKADSFDTVIDKATADAIVCCPDGEALVKKVFQEAWRVLKERGIFILISAQLSVEDILQSLKLPWNIGVMEIKTPLVNKSAAAAKDHVHFICCRKKKVEMSRGQSLMMRLMLAAAKKNRAEEEAAAEEAPTEEA